MRLPGKVVTDVGTVLPLGEARVAQLMLGGAPRFGIAARFQDKKAQRDSIANSYQPRNRRYGIPVPQFPEPTRAKAITKWEGHCRLGEIIDVRPEIEVLLLAVDSSADFRLRIPG